MVKKAAKKSAAPKWLPMHADDTQWAPVDERLKQEIGRRRPKPKDIARARAIAARLREAFPDATCALDFNNGFQLLVATILSAQCTDVRVNMVTPALWKKYPTPRAFVESPPGELEKDIHSTGFYNNKAKAIRVTARQIDEEFGGVLPSAMEELLKLRGAARKTANVVRSNAFGLPAITVDTHFSRIAARLGLTKEKDPEKIEFDVASLLPPCEWSHFSHAVIMHGRKTCTARKAHCEECPVADLCPSAFRAT